MTSPAAEADVPVVAPVPEQPDDQEGGVQGWFQRRKAEHARQNLETERYRAALAKVSTGDDAPETLAELEQLADHRSRKDAKSALIAYSDVLLADDLVSTDEEARWERVSDVLGVPLEDFKNDKEYAAMLSRLAIGAINDGRLPEVPPGQARLMAKQGEIVHIETGASLMKEVVDREFRGGSRGVSIPIGMGVRYRTGSFRGKSVVVGSHMEAADSGVISVSSKRVVFMGSRKTIDTPYTKLAGLDLFSDGIRIHASNRQTAPLLTIPVSAEVVAAGIQAAAQHVS